MPEHLKRSSAERGVLIMVMDLLNAGALKALFRRARSAQHVFAQFSLSSKFHVVTTLPGTARGGDSAI